jgi:SAM-dependent methyltransferase
MQENSAIEILGRVHGRLVHRRRVEVLAQHLSAMIEPGSRLLDIGCGDGKLDCLLQERVDGLQVQGAEIQPRADCAIPCKAFDGLRLPFADRSFDGCMFVDVLHHAPDAEAILREASRVSRSFILIKDHLAENRFAHLRLQFMDWVGNRPHGVVLPYNYFSRMQWAKLFEEVGLSTDRTDKDIPLYPPPLSLLFGNGLHFISRLKTLQA